MELSKKQRENLGKFLLDTSKLVLTALVLGGFLAGKPFNPKLFGLGLTIALILAMAGTWIDR